ncbi:MAG: matrixin family metalloprotease [Polyangiaceae bacterium]|nr:matrixin family metalloprotease [Polyangiaceae bacterium]
MMRGRAAWAVWSLLTTGCFFYNSEWGEGKRAQQRAAVRAVPATIASTDSASAPVHQQMRIRAYATPQYMSQVVEPERRFQESLDEANRAFAGVGVHWVLESFRPWNGPDDDLGKALDSIESDAPGREVDFHVGLVGALPLASEDVHKLGIARPFGHHLVMRAPSRAREVDAVERNFDELSEAEREKIRGTRRKHRASVVLIHELGHTLGAMHDNVDVSIMNPNYAPERASFGPENVGMMQITVRHRAAGEWTNKDLPKDLLARLDTIGPSSSVVPADLKYMREFLVALQAQQTAAANPPPATENVPADVRGLPAGDRALYVETKALFDRGESEKAWTKGAALFTGNPSVYSIQDLRCQVAMGRGLAYTESRPECEPVMQLSRAKK